MAYGIEDTGERDILGFTGFEVFDPGPGHELVAKVLNVFDMNVS